ncbi:MAG: CBS domain-containing protein [Myxococcota bacterium]|nr:CBS domain-containing protein [Myxococcota bacterium]
MSIGSYCRRDVRTVAVDETLRAAARRMDQEGVGCLVAVEGDLPRGVLTDRDVALSVIRGDLDPDEALVGEVIEPDPVTVHASSPLRIAARVMRRRGIRRLPVVDDHERLVGVIASDDLLALVSDELATLASAIRGQLPDAPAAADPTSGAGPEVE